MIIQNAYIYTPQHRFVRGDLCIRGGRIVPPCAPEPGETVLDAAGLYALPGLVDIPSTARWGMISATLTKPACRPLQILRPAKACWRSARPR